MGSIPADAVELEAISKEDSSWHPCQVSLSSDICTEFGLIVDFGNHDSEYIILTKEEALECIRIRSSPLQGDECLQIKEGVQVLASRETEFRSLFFDAEVVKVCRVRHSKRTNCRCTFEIKWLHPELKGATMTVPSSSILKLAKNNIDTHPTVAAFFSSMKTLNFSSISPFVSVLEDSIFEATLPNMLERQIEEISKLAEVSKEGCSQEILLELKRVDLTGQARQKPVTASHVKSRHDQNNSMRTTRNQRKLQQELKNLPPSQPILEEPDRPHLSPLGARAALASLMYKLPPKPEFSVGLMEKEGFSNASEITPEKHVSEVSFNVNHTFMDFDVCIQEKVSVKDDLFSRVEAYPVQDISKFPIFVGEDVQNKTSQTKGSRGMHNKLEKPVLLAEDLEDRSSNTANVKTRSYRSVNTTRLTRSAIQKGMGNLNDIVELKSSTEEMKLSNHTQTRLTRSAIQKEVRNLNVEGKQGLKEHKSTQDTCLESTKRNFVTPEIAEETRKKKPSSSPVDAETNLSIAQESNKKLRVSNVIRSTKRSEGEISGNGEALQGEKKSKTKPVIRSSPRLRFLPRTRSQKKSSLT